MPKIINPNAILNGYIIEFPTVGFINKYYKVDITPTDQSKLAHPQPQFLPKPKAGTIYNNIPDLLGFDVPVLIKTDKAFKGTIAILGQDALRDPNDPLLKGFNTKDDIVVGLPYAIAFDQNYKQVSVYHHLIKDILDAGYDVYLSDIWKSWGKKHDSRMGRWSNINPHKQCLEDEFKNLNINYVVLMGGVAQKKFKTIPNPSNVVDISVPHLSPAANGTWKDFLKDKPVDEVNKIEFVKDEMRKKGVKL